ncbi:hypothetical protein E2C01_061332 [Portunus trituberculatus]|uniref:Uncharacterized protein n=1 Tax=Portunus trituberculatus TaxID=210409 RepID=A0A5B7HB08_PORTR|nr:hypothetical protein [Portunus trituberculatus]
MPLETEYRSAGRGECLDYLSRDQLGGREATGPS